MKKKGFFLPVLVTVFFFLTGCERTQPVREYSLADVFPKSYSDKLDQDDTHTLFNFTLCQDSKTIWDSILVVKPYTNESLVKALPIQNYGSIKKAVGNQSLDDRTCTMLFVSHGKYVAFGVFSRTPIDFTTIDTGKPFVWINRQDCGKLYLRKDTADNRIFYRLQRKVKN